jgi:hypothetical protein
MYDDLRQAFRSYSNTHLPGIIPVAKTGGYRFPYRLVDTFFFRHENSSECRYSMIAAEYRTADNTFVAATYYLDSVFALFMAMIRST